MSALSEAGLGCELILPASAGEVSVSGCRRPACTKGLPPSRDGVRVLQDVTNTLKKARDCRRGLSVRLQPTYSQRRLAFSPDGWRVLQDVTDTLKKDREGRGARRWRTAFRRIQQQLIDLETDSRALELVYPQVRSLPVFGSNRGWRFGGRS